MKILFLSFILALGFGLGSLPSFADGTASPSNDSCYREICVGDRALNLVRDREVTVVGIERGQFFVRFDDGTYDVNARREDLALLRGCSNDLCVGYPALNAVLGFRSAKIAAIEWNGRYDLRFDDDGSLSKNWARSDLAVAWGCVDGICVNDKVFNRANRLLAMVVAVQTNAAGVTDRLVLASIVNGETSGNWFPQALWLIERGPTAYPPGRPCPSGTHWDPKSQMCVRDLPPPPPVCPRGTHWDPRSQSCVRDLPPSPPPPPVCPRGTHWNPRTQSCVRDIPPPSPKPTSVPPPVCPPGTHWDPRSNSCKR